MYFYIVCIDVPLIPTGLSLLPDSDDLTRLVFSWVPPAGSLGGVVVTYTPTLTDIPLDQTNYTFVQFDDDSALQCLPRNFSVFASNDAGDGPADFITETIPICMCIDLYVHSTTNTNSLQPPTLWPLTEDSN